MEEYTYSLTKMSNTDTRYFHPIRYLMSTRPAKLFNDMLERIAIRCFGSRNVFLDIIFNT